MANQNVDFAGEPEFTFHVYVCVQWQQIHHQQFQLYKLVSYTPYGKSLFQQYLTRHWLLVHHIIQRLQID